MHSGDNDPVRLISQFVEEMDLVALYDTYERMPSEKYVSPEIMLKIMLYAYHEGKEISSRTIEKNCKRDINYMYLLEGRRAPDHAAIARFRTKHFGKCANLFLSQMTKILLELKRLTKTEVFIDGTKSRHPLTNILLSGKKPSRNIRKNISEKRRFLWGISSKDTDANPYGGSR